MQCLVCTRCILEKVRGRRQVEFKHLPRPPERPQVRPRRQFLDDVVTNFNLVLGKIW